MATANEARVAIQATITFRKSPPKTNPIRAQTATVTA